MNDLIPVILSSTLVTTVLTLFVNAVANRRSASIENITKERKTWRDEMREIAKEIQSSKDSRQLRIALSTLKVRINAYGIAKNSLFNDAHFWHQIRCFEQKKEHTYDELEETKCIFVGLISCLLKFDWERSKAEIKGNLPTRVLTISLIVSFIIYSVKWFYFYDIGAGKVSNYFSYMVWYGVYVIFAILIIYFADKWTNVFQLRTYCLIGCIGAFLLYGVIYFMVPSAVPFDSGDRLVSIAPVAALLYCAEVKLLLYRKNMANFILSTVWVCGIEEIDRKYRVFFDQDTFQDPFADKVVKFEPKQKKHFSAKTK